MTVIVNPIKVDDPDGFRSVVHQALTDRGYDEPVWLETTVDDPGYAMARQVVDDPVDLLVVAGGDGTVRIVCAELAHTKVPIAILPSGTGNLLARNLGIPLQFETALPALLDGATRVIDIVGVEGDGMDSDRFTVMAGLGLDAAIMADAPDPLKKRLGWAAYLVSAAKNLNHRSVRVTITVDDHPPMKRRARTVIVGNVGTLTADVALLPDARPDDGLIDVVVLTPTRLSHWPGLAWRILTRSVAPDRHVHRLAGRRIHIEAARPMQRQLDGDPIEPGRTLTAQVERDALSLRTPSEPDA